MTIKCFECDSEVTRICLVCNPLAGEWQPMEAAPKDGTHILILWEWRNGRFASEGFWWTSTTDAISGWVKEDSDHKGQTPAFWQPLPAAPDYAQDAVRVAKQATGED